jgi:hypothetical protein
MKQALFTLLFVLPSLALAVSPKANLSGVAEEAVRLDNGATGRSAATARLVESSRSQTKDSVTIYLRALESDSTAYESVLHEIQTADLHLDLNHMSARGESSMIAADLQILGDDDQRREAKGTCLLNLDQSLECQLEPTFNAYGLLDNTVVLLDLN